MVLGVITYALYKKVDVYDIFIKGAKEGIQISMEIFPCLLAMLLAINILLKSNIIIDFLNLLKPLFNLIKVPIEIIPMSIMRPISGNASLVLMNDIFTKYGVDSFLGRLASTIQGSTETTLYVLTLYFGVVGIKKIRYAMWVGLLADLVGIIASVIVVRFIFG
jgi:spore maturation protein B